MGEYCGEFGGMVRINWLFDGGMEEICRILGRIFWVDLESWGLFWEGWECVWFYG